MSIFDKINKVKNQTQSASAPSFNSKKETFTFQPETDFFVEGDTTGVPVLEDGFFEYMQKHFDNVFHVSTVDEYKDVMKHLEVGGK